MSATLENTHTNISTRLTELKKILTTYDRYQIDQPDRLLLQKLLVALDQIRVTYDFGTMPIISDYYLHKTSEAERKKNYVKYMDFVTLENIVGRIKRIYQDCKKFYDTYAIDNTELNDAFNLYDASSISLHCVDRSEVRCNACDEPYFIEEKNSEFVCHKCGMSVKLMGIVFSDDQFYYQEGQRTKHGKYDPTKHCRFWVDRILARKDVELPRSLIAGVKRRIRSDEVWLSDVTCATIRRYLRDLRMTKWNDHIPLILKTVTRREIQQLTDHEMNLVFMYFSRSIDIYGKIKDEDKTNCPYHPFFIYKIIEQILKNPEDAERKKEILSYIHLQERQTLIDKDLIWKRICEHIPEFQYQPTE